MKWFREISVILSTISAIFFAVYYAFALHGNVKSVGPYPLWLSILGACFMCCFPVYAIRVGGSDSRKGALLFSIVSLLVSGAHLLSLVYA
jgi:hypothetical protein